MKELEVLHGELLLESQNDLPKQSCGRGRENDVIHIEQEVSHVTTTVIDEQRGVCLDLNKFELQQKGYKLAVPCPGAYLSLYRERFR